MDHLLDIRDLQVFFDTGEGVVQAVDGVNLHLDRGETLALVGESGCGKSVTALSVAQLVPSPPSRIAGGQILLDGEDTLRMSNRELRGIRGSKVSYVFQEPAAALNPVFRVGAQIGESIQLHQPSLSSREQIDQKVIDLLKSVGIPSPEQRMRDYPHQLSGGMQQRVVIAMALASEPSLLIADEPTTALDVTIQAQILALLKGLNTRLGTAILLITHNLGVVAEVADRLAVMYAGQVVETGPVEEVLARPGHPYTRALLDSLPHLGQEGRRLNAIPGSVPHPGEFPPGCRFQPRCRWAHEECTTLRPEMETIEPGRRVRCPYWKSVT